MWKMVKNCKKIIEKWKVQKLMKNHEKMLKIGWKLAKYGK